MTITCQIGKVEGSKYGYFMRACLVGYNRKRSSWFAARIDTGADVTIVPATAFREITPVFQIGMVNLVYGDGRLEKGVKTFGCGIYVEGLGTLQSRCGIVPKNLEIGLLGMDVLRNCRFYMDGEKRGLLSRR